MRILYNDENIIERSMTELFEKAAKACLEKEGIDPSRAEISVTFASKDEIRQLNRSYRDIDSPTDVLSFPLVEDFENLEAEQDIMLGDVVICPEKAEEQAEEYGHSIERELVYLFVHSVCHLLGFDHMEEEEKAEMRQREEEIMALLDLERKQVTDAEKLYETACKALENAYVPFSGFKVGAALLTSEGKVYTGVNVENSSYGATICAERTAFVKAISEGERSFRAIAVAASSKDGEWTEALPCGICRQFMYEFAPELQVITGTDAAHLNIRTLEELLPLGFRL